MTESEHTSTSTTPTCYRHSDRETWVKCGRCGKPLCPDCMLHGPVGVRCRECLLPQGTGSGLVAPTHLGAAIRAAAGMALAGLVAIVALSLFTGAQTDPLVHFGSLLTERAQTAGAGELVRYLLTSPNYFVWAPNLLLSGAAGGLIGWTIWRLSQKTWNHTTLRVAVVLAAAVPLVAALVIAGWLALHQSLYVLTAPFFYLRTVLAAGLSVFMAWLLATNND